MPKLNGRVPKYSLHRASGRAVVTLDGTDHYLGEFDSPESKAKYDRLIAEWLATRASRNAVGIGDRTPNVRRSCHGSESEFFKKALFSAT